MDKNLINLHSLNWLDAVQNQVLELSSSHPQSNVYALIDCAFSERCYATLKQQSHVLQWRSLFDLSSSPNEQLAAISPTLLPLDPDNVSSWRAVLRQTNGMPMLSMIVTPESLEALTQRLQTWCVVDADGEHYCFRFADTRRLPDIIATLTPQQHGEFFGPAQAWICRNRSAEWMHLAVPAMPQPAAQAVQLSSTQSARLIGASEADEIMADIAVYNPALVQTMPPAQAYMDINKALLRAEQGAISEQDRYVWCMLWLQHPKMAKLVQLPDWLDDHRRGKRSYEELVSALQSHAIHA